MQDQDKAVCCHVLHVMLCLVCGYEICSWLKLLSHEHVRTFVSLTFLYCLVSEQSFATMPASSTMSIMTTVLAVN